MLRWPYPEILLAAACLALAGCGKAELKRQLGLATESVEAGLEAWKQGASAQTLTTRSTPIEFHDDDWQQSARLIDYEVVSAYHETDGTPRCAVLLTIESGQGEPRQLKVTYQVLTEPKVIIARDPFS
jgi:hypothetical protein